mgnify:CR=1 FL=1
MGAGTFRCTLQSPHVLTKLNRRGSRSAVAKGNRERNTALYSQATWLRYLRHSSHSRAALSSGSLYCIIDGLSDLACLSAPYARVSPAPYDHNSRVRTVHTIRNLEMNLFHRVCISQYFAPSKRSLISEGLQRTGPLRLNERSSETPKSSRHALHDGLTSHVSTL